MKRPALYVSIPYVLGLSLASAVSGQLRLGLPAVLLLTGLTVLIWRKDLWKYILLSTLSCLTACCVYWHTDSTAGKLLTHAGEEQSFTGRIVKTAVYASGSARYHLSGEFSDGTPARVEYFSRTAVFSYGDTLTLQGIPERLSGSYLFDTAASAKANGIFLSYDSTAAVTEFQLLRQPTLRSLLYSWRDTMARRIRARMGEETGAILTGMLFGDKSGMTRASKTLLYRMGIGHVLAVSGLHLDFLALLAEALLKKLRAGRTLSAAVMTVLCLLFVLLAGETVSVKRACIMVLLRQCGYITFRKPDSLNSLSIAAFLLTLENPFVIHAAAFWLSVTAAWGIAVLAPFMTQNLKRESVLQIALADVCACCWCFAAVLPVSILYFREISFLSPISNTLLLPVCMGAMLLGALALLFGCHGLPAEILLDGADVMNGWILTISRAVTSFSWTHFPTGSSVLLFTVIAGIVLTAVIFLLSRSRRLTTYTVLLALLVSSLSVGAEQTAQRGTLRLAVLGTEKARLLLLTDGREAVLVDFTGQKQLPAYAEAYLTETGISHVETLYLCKPSRKSMMQYESDLTCYPPAAVCILKENMTAVPTLFGIVPSRTAQRETLFHGAKLTVTAKETTLTYGNITCLFTAAAATETPEILYYYGKPPQTVPDCGMLFVPEGTPCLPDSHTYIGETSIELTLTQDGTCRIRRLYGET